MSHEKTDNIDKLTGDSKRAILVMTVPFIISLLAMALNNTIDSVWVSGIGPLAVAATGYVLPLFIIILGFGNGIGIGASSLISKFIGANERKNANTAAFQSILIMLIIGSILTVVLLLFEEPILRALGVGDALEMARQYATPLILCTLVIVFNAMFSNLLRAEGDSKKAMYAQLTAACINIVLDPIFIYSSNDMPFGLGMGIAGASWATVLAFAVSLLIQIYWYCISKATYVDLSSNKFELKGEYDREILKVGMPSSFEVLIMSLCIIFVNIMIGGNGQYTDNVTIYACVWRILNIYLIPLIAIAGALVPILGAAYGSNDHGKIRTAYIYSIKVGVLLMIVCIVISLVFGDQIMMLFTYNESMAHLRPEMVEVLRILSFMLPFMTLGYVATGFFQSMGMGSASLLCSIVRYMLQLPVIFVMTTVSMSMSFLVWGVFLGEVAGSVIAFLWSSHVLRNLLAGSLSRFHLSE